MKTININTQENVETILFPDNQPHVVVKNINPFDKVKVVVRLKTCMDLINLSQVANALNHIGAVKTELHIPYLMGARYDRHMIDGDSFDLEVIATQINLCGFEKVYLYDVHSKVSLDLIQNSWNVNNHALVNAYQIPNSILICPDKGASSKVHQLFEWNRNLVDVVYCEKDRDLATGRITLKVLEPEKCKDRNCVVIDDLCDGGGTFLGIASQIQPRNLSLIVTHGLFTKGFSEIEKYYNQIITSNTYKSHYDSRIVKVINII